VSVAEILDRLRGRDVDLLPNLGNAGDGLIYLSLLRLCAMFGIRLRQLTYPEPASGNVLVVLGCGNLCAPHHTMTEMISRYVSNYRRVYILPCSIDTDDIAVEHFLRSLPDHVDVFCRERYSLARARFAMKPARVHLDHDLAFSFDYDPWKRAGTGTLYAFRTDVESAGNPLPETNLDVSADTSHLDGDLLPDKLRDYERVFTDRAHVAICAAMLGKETHVFPNNYHKVRGIYEYSLRDLPNTFFHAEAFAWPEAVS
jgi:exopolysaccharide biosynthesis predicted pyruvyltransferase EpsI